MPHLRIFIVFDTRAHLTIGVQIIEVPDELMECMQQLIRLHAERTFASPGGVQQERRQVL